MRWRIRSIRTSGSTRTGRSSRTRARSRWARESTPGWRRSSPRSSMPISIRSWSSTPPTAVGRRRTCTAILTSAARSRSPAAPNSTKGFWIRYRLVAAQARARLAAAAAELWDVPADEVAFERGVVRHASGQAGDVRDSSPRARSGCRFPTVSSPRRLSDYTLIGGARLRVDSVPKILGTTRFTIDVSVPWDADRGRAAPAAVRRDGRIRGRSRRRCPSPASPRW